MMTRPAFAKALLITVFIVCTVNAQPKRRARESGIPFPGTPGPLNAITDVRGVEVGHTTLISGEGKLTVGAGPIRTGVTAVLPRGRTLADPVPSAWFSLNGNGEMTGTTWIEESGFLEGPVAITNTHSVGVVRDAIIAWGNKRRIWKQPWSLPVVAETWDGWLNDINGFHVKQEHVFAALDNARSGAVAEGNVGGGTGMICYGFKGGIGTASRVGETRGGPYRLGVLVQANFGARRQLRIAGVPIGEEIVETPPQRSEGDLGSIIIVIATDTPLLPHQLKRIARRAALGIARTGGTSGNSSGDIFIAFSTANTPGSTPVSTLTMLGNDHLDPLFEATVQATEEAIINALFAAETLTGVDGHTVQAIPRDRVLAILRKYNRAK